MDKKTHAKDYLLEYSKGKPEWLKVLIEESIETNGAISEERQNEIFECLVNESSITKQVTHSMAEGSTQPTADSSSDEKLIFKKLTHKCGVNALCENQTIKFSKDVTVLYGLNGSGKSSYFRILNELVGGNQEKKILPNIYKSDNKDVNVLIEYEMGEKQKETITFDNKKRAFSEFKNVKVFDSSYLNGLLESRTPDETWVFPLGLHLFKHIENIMDSYARKCEQLKREERDRIPPIKTDDLRDELKNKFINRDDFSDSERESIIDCFGCGETVKNDLEIAQKNLENLLQSNYRDKIELLVKKNTILTGIMNKIDDVVNKLKRYEKILQESFVTLQYAQDKNNKALQQSNILKKLPKSNTPEWKNFIQAGQSYSLKLEEEDKKRCPYCHQELKANEAIKIIQAYTDFLNDTSEAELSKAKKDVDDIKKDIEKLDTTIPLMEEISDIVNNYEQFKEKYTQLHLYKKSLLNAIKKDDINDFKFNFEEEIILIDIEIKKNDKQIKELSSSQEDKDKEITKLQKKIAGLKEKVSISEQKDDIKEYFSVYDTLKKYEIKKKDLTTGSLTRIANEAHANLLTESLRSRFQTELQCLGRNDLKVQLIVVNGNKGNCITQLQLCGKFKLTNILSEGEQKAVGLAMFFAEIQSGNNPIILDDPTTSLDHKIAKKLAVRLISFTNQVIIFTHHQLFLNFLNSDKYKGHFCGKYGEKTCNKSGKHIFVYYVDESIYEKGVIEQYDGQNAETYIEKIGQEIISITTSNLKNVPTNMRKCIDYIIDEKILKEQLLRKYSAGDQIRWDILKQLNPSLSQSIDKLHKIYGRVSGGAMHVGLESEENPLTPEELSEYLQDLKSIYSEGKEK